MNACEFLNIMNDNKRENDVENINRWNSLECELGIEFPVEYKDVINKLGTIGIDDFIWILNP